MQLEDRNQGGLKLGFDIGRRNFKGGFDAGSGYGDHLMVAHLALGGGLHHPIKIVGKLRKIVFAAKLEFAVPKAFSILIKRLAELKQRARDPVGHKQADQKRQGQKRDFGDREKNQHLPAGLMKDRDGSAVGLHRRIPNKIIKEIADDQRINKTKRQDPAADISAKAKLKRLINENSSALVRGHNSKFNGSQQKFKLNRLEELLPFNSEAFDRRPAHQMGPNNLSDILSLDRPVPNIVGINDHRGPKLAGIEAPSLLGPDLASQPRLGDLLFKGFDELFGPLGLAAAPGVPRRAIIGADEDVSFELARFF